MKIAFGSCCRFERRKEEQPVWQQIYEWQPDLFIFLGDNIYNDESKWKSKADAERRYVQQYREGRFKYLEKLMNEVPYIATWDDHDLGPNNAKGAYDAMEFRKVSRSLFLKYLKPSLKSQAGRIERHPKKIYCTYEIAGILVIVLDVRFYRNMPSKADTDDELLGKVQTEWLWKQLKRAKNGNYRATVVCSGSTSKYGGVKNGEAMLSYKAFYNRFKADFSRCPTPILLAGDIHRNSYQPHQGLFTELISSGLAQYLNGEDEILDNWGALEFGENGYKYKLNGNQRNDRSLIIAGERSYKPAQSAH